MPLPLLAILLFTLSPLVSGQDRFVTRTIEATEHIKETVRRGHVTHLRQHSASFESPGYIQQVNAEPGDSFVAGETLAQLDTTPLNHQKQQLQARLDFLNNEYLRLQTLLDRRLIAPTEFENIEAQRRQREAEMAQIKYKLEHARIRADFDGVVVNRRLDAGTYVQPGQTVLTLAPKQNNWVVELYLTNEEMTRLNKMASFTIEHTRQAQQWMTQVHSAALSPQPDSQLYQLRLRFENYPGLLDGTPVDVRLPQPQGKVFKVPHNAVLSASQGQADIMVRTDNDYHKQRLAITDMDQGHIYLVADRPQLTLVVNSWIMR